MKSRKLMSCGVAKADVELGALMSCDVARADAEWGELASLWGRESWNNNDADKTNELNNC